MGRLSECKASVKENESLWPSSLSSGGGKYTSGTLASLPCSSVSLEKRAELASAFACRIEGMSLISKLSC